MVVVVGRAGADDTGRAGRRVIGRLVVGGWRLGWRHEWKVKVAWSRTSKVPTEDEFEFMGEVSVDIPCDMLDGKVSSEVTVGGLYGGRS